MVYAIFKPSKFMFHSLAKTNPWQFMQRSTRINSQDEKNNVPRSDKVRIMAFPCIVLHPQRENWYLNLSKLNRNSVVAIQYFLEFVYREEFHGIMKKALPNVINAISEQMASQALTPHGIMDMANCVGAMAITRGLFFFKKPILSTAATVFRSKRFEPPPRHYNI